MAVSQDDPRAHDIEPYDLREQLVGLKGSSKKINKSPKFHWATFQIPVLVFILNKTILYFTQFAADTKTIIDILIVIAIVAGLNIYFHKLNQET